MPHVLCFGPICADLRLVLPRFPRPGEGMHVQHARWTPGGNALIEARALVGWGLDVALMGDDLGTDAPGDLIAAELQRIGLHALVRQRPEAQTVVCHILLTPDGQRTILALRPSAAQPDLPTLPLLSASRVVSLTRYGPRSAQVAATARKAGCLVVAGDVTRTDEPLALHADVIVTSAELLAQASERDIAAHMAALHAVRGAAVIVTDGPRSVRALWLADGTLHTASVIPPLVSPGDTTGAGDLFRAAVVLGLVRGWPWPQTLEHAVAAASAALG